MAAPCDPKYPDPSTYTRPPGFDIKISGSPKNYGRPFWIDLNKVEGTDGPWLGFCDEVPDPRNQPPPKYGVKRPAQSQSGPSSVSVQATPEMSAQLTKLAGELALMTAAVAALLPRLNSLESHVFNTQSGEH